VPHPPSAIAFHGIFGAGNFASFTDTGALVGGALGQTILLPRG
jgi:hypothetical protein